MWMSDKRYYPLNIGDVSLRLDLIAKVHGIEQAEKYFNNVPRQLKASKAYHTFLNCYVHAGLVEKAEALMQLMKDLGFASSSLSYNVLLKLYYKTGDYEKMDTILHEMEKKGIGPDKFTYGTQISAYVANSDVKGIDEILTRVETDREALYWSIYSIAANGYIKAGLVDKALLMLKKSEELIVSAEKESIAFQCILTQYATIGKKDEVLRLWEVYKNQLNVYNNGYVCVIASLLKSDDIESAEKIFEEWESKNLNYDSCVPNSLIAACCRKGLLEKAKNLLNRVIEKGGKTDAKTWQYLATGYLHHNQMQKAVEATKEEILLAESWWKPTKIFAACLVYLKGKGDVEGGEEIIRLVAHKGLASVNTQERLLNYIRGIESNSEVPLEILGYAVDGNDETSELLAADKDGGDSRSMLAYTPQVIEKGGKADAMTWHYLVIGYLHHNQMEKAVEASKEEISLALSWWRPTKNFATCLGYLKEKGELDGAKEIIRLAADKGLVYADTQERLLNYIKDGKSNSEVPFEMKETSELLAAEEDGAESRNMLVTNA